MRQTLLFCAPIIDYYFKLSLYFITLYNLLHWQIRHSWYLIFSNPDDDETVPIVEVADRVIGLSFEDSSDEETELSEDNGSRSIPRDHVREPKSICFEENLLQLAKMKVSSLCHVKGCDAIVDMKTKYIGSTVRIIWVSHSVFYLLCNYIDFLIIHHAMSVHLQ